MRKSIGVVHAIFECETCGWNYGKYRNAQALAAIHAKKYGHVVKGEIGIAVTYDGSKEE